MLVMASSPWFRECLQPELPTNLDEEGGSRTEDVCVCGGGWRAGLEREGREEERGVWGREEGEGEKECLTFRSLRPRAAPSVYLVNF